MGRLATLRMLGALCVTTALAAAAVAVDPAALAGARPAARCLVPGTAKTIDQLWRPDMAAAVAYARSRVGDIAFAVRTQDRFYGYRPDHDEWSASVVKAMLLVDLPRQRGGARPSADDGPRGRAGTHDPGLGQ